MNSILLTDQAQLQEMKELGLLCEASEVFLQFGTFVHIPLCRLLDSGFVHDNETLANAALDRSQLCDLTERLDILVTALRAGQFDRYVVETQIHGEAYAS